MPALEVSDFTGKWQVATDQYTKLALQPYIDKYVPFYLAKLLGATLSNDLITDIGAGSSPTDPTLLLIWQSFQIDGTCGEIHISEGIKAYLLGLVYWHFMTDKRVNVNPVSGTSSAKTENSINRHIPEPQIYSRWNESVDTMKAIHWYICQNSSDYPDFNGQSLLYNSAF